MKNIEVQPNYKSLARNLSLVFFLLLATQLLFGVLNRNFFSVTSSKEWLLIFFGSIRYTVASVSIFLAPFVFLFLLPFAFRTRKFYPYILSTFYYLGSLSLLIFNIIDIVYYRFTFSRMGGEIFRYLSVGGDFKKLAPAFIKDFWLYAVLFLVAAVLLVLFHRRSPSTVSRKVSLSSSILRSSIACLIVFILTQLSPPFQLKYASVLRYTSPSNAALVINTPYSILSTLAASKLEELHYFPSEEKAALYFTPLNLPHPRSGTFEANPRQNIVFILLESFSAEYMGFYNEGKESYTPFLDSLAKKSLVFDGMSNGKRSIEALPACLAGIPSLTREGFVMSPFHTNTINSLPSVLKKYAYYSAFFHGGHKQAMGFDIFTKCAGFDTLFSMDDYEDKSAFDGVWGIYDEEYLQFMAGKLNTFQQPFFSMVFTLSSHHPYSIPPQYKGKFAEGEIPILKTIRYADYALQKFFEKVSSFDWYKNTLFVITADHTAQPLSEMERNPYGMYRIPLILFSPSDTIGNYQKRLVQQADLLPSLVDYLDLNEKTIAFGKSAFSPDTTQFHIAYVNGFYQMIYGEYLVFYKDKVEAVYNIKKDPLLKNNLYPDQKLEDLERYIDALLQQYNYRMIHNLLQP